MSVDRSRGTATAMATHEHKIDHLDQPYYGPAIPPTEPAAAADDDRGHLDRRYALVCRAFRALTVVLIALGIVALVLWLVFQPDSLKAYVDSAQLTRFDLAVPRNSTGAQLYYNLTVAMSIRNPNRRQAVVYRRLEAVALYGPEHERFGYAGFPRMRQKRKSTMELWPSFHGQGPVAGTAAATFAREKGEGFFNINVKLHMRARLKVIIVNSVEYRPDVDCYIRVPDPTNVTAVAQGFTPTQCHVDDFS